MQNHAGIGKWALLYFFVAANSYANDRLRIDCKIVQVGESRTAPIRISCGSADGIRVGHKFDVFRNRKTWIGTIIIVETSVDEARAKILTLKRGQVFKKGDFLTIYVEGR